MFALLVALVAVNVWMCLVMGIQAARYARHVGSARRNDVSVSLVVPVEEPIAVTPPAWGAPIEVVVASPALGEPPPLCNRKAWFLSRATPRLQHNVIVTMDGRVQPDADTLAGLVAQLDTHVAAFAASVAVPRNPFLAAVSRHLARAHPHGWPILAGLAWTTGDVPPAAGSMMAVRADALRAAGGFEAVHAYIADDLVLARHLADVGSVVLAPVEARVQVDHGWFERWVRWIRVGVSTSPWRGFSYPTLLAPFPLAVCLAAASGEAVAWALVAALVASRFLLGVVRGDRDAWTGPVADVLLLAAATAAAASTAVRWHKQHLGLAAGGAIVAPGRGVPPVAYALLALFALFGLGFRLDRAPLAMPDAVFLLAEGLLCVLALKPWQAAVVMAGGFAAEVVGVHTGLPFGRYVYTDTLGPQLWDTPLLMAPTWVVATTSAAALARGRWLPAVGVLVLTDVVLDPLAGGPLGYWIWEAPAWSWYGVPYQNFLGWALVGAPLLLVVRGAINWRFSVIAWTNLVYFGVLAASHELWGAAAVAAVIGVYVAVDRSSNA